MTDNLVEKVAGEILAASLHSGLKGAAEAAIAIVLKEAAKVAMVDDRPAPKAATTEEAKWWQYGRDDTSQEIYDNIRALGDKP